MKGLEVSVNDDRTMIGSENGIISLVVDAENLSLSITGYDNSSYSYLKWRTQELKLGDTIKISFKNIKSNISPASVRKETLYELLEKYEKLKEEYTKMGWI